MGAGCALENAADGTLVESGGLNHFDLASCSAVPSDGVHWHREVCENRAVRSQIESSAERELPGIGGNLPIDNIYTGVHWPEVCVKWVRSGLLCRAWDFGHNGWLKRVFPRISRPNKKMDLSTADRFCVLGAGTSGLAVAKNFQQAGIPFDCLEREDDLGGNWNFGKSNSSVYASTHLISSKRLTEYTDYPMPDDYPEFPGHRQVLAYVRGYAKQFDLIKHIQFNTSVEKVEPCEDGWRVVLTSGEERQYRGVVIANGHNWDPRLPEYPGEFAGSVFHSSEYKTPDVLHGKRVLVVGGGNSGCDLAVEAAIHADQAFHSLRRGYHVLPKLFKGKPIDQCGETLHKLRLPLWARRMGAALAIRWVLGPTELAGLPKPEHRLFESHPIINSRLHGQLAHGKLSIRPDIAELRADGVRFVDGTEEAIDVILYATGFRLSFPFIDPHHLNWDAGRPNLFLNIFHPQRDNLFCAGLIQPDSGQWGLVDYQAQLIVRYLNAMKEKPRAARWFRRLKESAVPEQAGRIRYLDSPRHRLGVEHFSYRSQLQKLIAKLA